MLPMIPMIPMGHMGIMRTMGTMGPTPLTKQRAREYIPRPAYLLLNLGVPGSPTHPVAPSGGYAATVADTVSLQEPVLPLESTQRIM